MKYNFRANRATEELIEAATALTGNRSEFINLCIERYGKTIVREIMREKKRLAEIALRAGVKPRKAPQKGGSDGGLVPSRGVPT